MKRILLCVPLVCSMHALSAQAQLTSSANGLRGGDKLCKVKVSYIAPGERGTDQVWPLGQVNKHCKEFRQSIAVSRDTMVVFERDRILHYLMKGDTLVDKGEQSRRAYCLYDQERPLLRFPFQYGDSIWGDFSGHGRYENLTFTRSGFGYTVADGTGIMTDGTDTLRHVARLHYADVFTEQYNDTLSFRTRLDRYAWFCAGYRYPVMESMHWSAIVDDTLSVPTDSVTFLFLPFMQEEDLAEDSVNDSIKEEIIRRDALLNGGASNGLSAISNLQAGVSSDGSKLHISFSVPQESGSVSVSFIACDVLGNVLGASNLGNVAPGDYTESISLSRRPVGNVVMLSVKCGEETITMKVNQ